MIVDGIWSSYGWVCVTVSSGLSLVAEWISVEKGSGTVDEWGSVFLSVEEELEYLAVEEK